MYILLCLDGNGKTMETWSFLRDDITYEWVMFYCQTHCWLMITVAVLPGYVVDHGLLYSGISSWLTIPVTVNLTSRYHGMAAGET